MSLALGRFRCTTDETSAHVLPTSSNLEPMAALPCPELASKTWRGRNTEIDWSSCHDHRPCVSPRASGSSFLYESRVHSRTLSREGEETWRACAHDRLALMMPTSRGARLPSLGACGLSPSRVERKRPQMGCRRESGRIRPHRAQRWTRFGATGTIPHGEVRFRGPERSRRAGFARDSELRLGHVEKSSLP